MPAYSESIEFNWNFGNFGWEMSVAPDAVQHSVSISLMNFLFANPDTRLAIEINPVKFSTFWGDAGEYESMSLANASLLWSPFRMEGAFEYSLFGPFISVNWLQFYRDRDFSITEAVFTTGLRFAWQYFFEDSDTISIDGAKFPIPPSYNYLILGVEAGYRNIAGKDTFFLCVRIDNISLGLFALMVSYDSAKKQAAKDIGPTGRNPVDP